MTKQETANVVKCNEETAQPDAIMEPAEDGCDDT